MTDSIDTQAFERVARAIDPGCALLEARPLEGGISAQVVALDVCRADGQRSRWVLRRHGALDFQANPHIARDEFGLLEHLHTAGLPVPAPVFLDVSSAILPTPYLVVEFVQNDGIYLASDRERFLRYFAATLAAIHAQDLSVPALAYLPDLAAEWGADIAKPSPAADTFDSERVRTALKAVWPLPARNAPVLLHGDYWPGNLLWHKGSLAAVIDWEDAGRGDPLADLANSRLELLWATSEKEIVRDFTRLYQALRPVDLADLPYWDLVVALRRGLALPAWGLDEAAETAMERELHTFVERAFAALADR